MGSVIKNAEKNGRILNEAKLAKRKHSWFVETLIFMLVFVIGSAVQGIVTGVLEFTLLFRDEELMARYMKLSLTAGMSEMNAIINELLEKNADVITLTTLYTFVGLIAAAIIYTVCIQKRSFASMGFSGGKKAISHYLFGFLGGALAIGASIGISALCGATKISVSESVDVKLMALYFFGFIIQGAAEEILLRGYYLPALAVKGKTIMAITLSSIYFSVLHFSNSGINIVAVLNLVLYAVVMALYILRTDNIWGACAFHSAWNFVQGNVFGAKVSGMTTSSVFSCENVGADLLTGGNFGPEGSLCVTLVLLAIFGVIVFVGVKDDEDKNDVTDGENVNG